MTSKPIAVQFTVSIQGDDWLSGYHIPIGTLTPTNSPFCNAGPTPSTVLPMAIPIPMARMIQTTRKRSRNDKALSGGSSPFLLLDPVNKYEFPFLVYYIVLLTCDAVASLFLFATCLFDILLISSPPVVGVVYRPVLDCVHVDCENIKS